MQTPSNLFHVYLYSAPADDAKHTFSASGIILLALLTTTSKFLQVLNPSTLDLSSILLQNTRLLTPISNPVQTSILDSPHLPALHTPLMSHTPHPLSMLIRINVIHQQLPMLPISQRLIPRRLYDIEPAPPPLRRLAEYAVDFLKRAVCCLGVEEVDYGEDECIPISNVSH